MGVAASVPQPAERRNRARKRRITACSAWALAVAAALFGCSGTVESANLTSVAADAHPFDTANLEIASGDTNADASLPDVAQVDSEVTDAAPPDAGNATPDATPDTTALAHRPPIPNIITEEGWGWRHPMPLTAHFSGVFGLTATDVWLFGRGAIHYDGAKWRYALDGHKVTAMSATSTKDVWASTNDGMMHFDGKKWTGEIAIEPAAKHAFNAMWSNSATDVWAVDQFGGIRHFNGKTWSLDTTSMPLKSYRRLNGVWGTGSDDMWAVGAAGVIMHFDGKSWSVMPGVGTPEFVGVWGTSKTDVWALASNGPNAGVLRYDGQKWQLVHKVSGPTSLTGTSASDVWVTHGATVGMFADRFDGTKWTTSKLPDYARKLWAAPGGEVFEVSSNIGGAPAHFDGKTWLELAEPPVTTEDLNAVWASSPTNAWAVGVGATLLHYDGQWTAAPKPPNTDVLFAVWGSSASDVFAVGVGKNRILHFDGNAWLPMASTGTNGLMAVWGSGPKDVWAAGGKGELQRYDGAVWTAVTSPTDKTLVGIWGSSATDVWAVGDAGVFHFDGSKWAQSLPSTFGAKMTAIWGTGPKDIWVAGGAKSLQHYDGSAWTPMAPGCPVLLAFTHMWGGSGKQAWGTDAAGRISRFDGTKWVCAPGPPHGWWGQALNGVGGSGDNDVWVVGRNGAILHFDDPLP